MKHIDITPGVCGNSNHQWSMTGEEEGCVIVKGITYHWYGGCPSCVDIKLQELINET